MLDNLKKYNIVLASASPRRQQLLSELGLKFEVRPSHIEEFYPDYLGMTAIPVYLAELKAETLRDTMKDNDLIITADTIVWKDNIVLNKPSTREECIEMLYELSGAHHQVITGMHLMSLSKKVSFHAVSEVYFEELSEEEIVYYVDNFNPMDKAGGYGAQEWIGYVAISRIDGSFYNVMGLPVHKLYQHLKNF